MGPRGLKKGGLAQVTPPQAQHSLFPPVFGSLWSPWSAPDCHPLTSLDLQPHPPTPPHTTNLPSYTKHTAPHIHTPAHTARSHTDYGAVLTPAACRCASQPALRDAGYQSGVFTPQKPAQATEQARLQSRLPYTLQPAFTPCVRAHTHRLTPTHTHSTPYTHAARIPIQKHPQRPRSPASLHLQDPSPPNPPTDHLTSNSPSLEGPVPRSPPRVLHRALCVRKSMGSGVGQTSLPPIWALEFRQLATSPNLISP